ncbi:hypothetical protein EMG21_27595 [Klebsiella pneumoniae]|nr:hypothetical protein EMG21_27595 [Klebsiella pneumoniae]
MDTTDPRRHALHALNAWAARRDALATDRAELMAAAWRAGERTIALLARHAAVSRDTVYADLRSQGIDPTDRSTRP